jgi:hypothetical protein
VASGRGRGRIRKKAGPSLMQGLPKRNMAAGTKARAGSGGCRKGTKRDFSQPQIRRRTAKGSLFRPLQALEALLYAPPCEQRFRLILGSSAVEHSTVNRMVAGSNPARGASQIKCLSNFFNLSQNACVCKSIADRRASSCSLKSKAHYNERIQRTQLR